MKKFFYLLLTCFALSCTVDNDSIYEEKAEKHLSVSDYEGKSGTAPVSLVKSFSSYSFYRGFATYTREFLVKVSNLAFDKKVSIFHETENGEWEEIRLAYKSSLTGNEELWYGIESMDVDVYADEFVVRYEVDGTVYWDNNNGNNYRMDDRSGTLFGDPNLSVSVDEKSIALFDTFQGGKRFSLIADVKNIAPTKDVQVVYTTDNWSSVNYAPMEFIRFWSIGYISSISSPNPYGVERWGAFIDVDGAVENVRFAVVYTVNGEEFWDNNNETDYTVVSR